MHQIVYSQVNLPCTFCSIYWHCHQHDSATQSGEGCHWVWPLLVQVVGHLSWDRRQRLPFLSLASSSQQLLGQPCPEQWPGWSRWWSECCGVVRFHVVASLLAESTSNQTCSTSCSCYHWCHRYREEVELQPQVVLALLPWDGAARCRSRNPKQQYVKLNHNIVLLLIYFLTYLCTDLL